jgi:hypothetical protein
MGSGVWRERQAAIVRGQGFKGQSGFDNDMRRAEIVLFLKVEATRATDGVRWPAPLFAMCLLCENSPEDVSG